MSASTFPSLNSTHDREFDLLGGLRRRIVLSLAVLVGWVSFVLLYVAFWATRFSLFQSIIVMIVSVVVLGGTLLGAWISFGLKFVGGWSD
jgi:hypothetical protein